MPGLRQGGVKSKEEEEEEVELDALSAVIGRFAGRELWECGRGRS